mgnify:CR=1 FL=1
MIKSFLFFSVLLIGSPSVNSQNKKEPSVKETFDFIVYYMSNNVQDRNEYDNFTILETNFDDLRIVFEDEIEGMGDYLETWKISFSLNDVKGVKLNKGWDYDEYTGKLNEDGAWDVLVVFKEDSVKEWLPKKYPHPNGKGVFAKTNHWNQGDTKIQNVEQFTFRFDYDKKINAEKMKRAFEHMIKLKSGINTSLFDN